jgi:uncharacterized repeat protein (TIGR03803 family)
MNTIRKNLVVYLVRSLVHFAVITCLALLASAQTFSVLHTFTGGGDGFAPAAGVSMDAAGNLYGATSGSNFGFGQGLVYKLSYKSSAWILTPLYNFHGPYGDGISPNARPAVASDGTLYGTTPRGGISCDFAGCGIVYHLTPAANLCRTVECQWTETFAYEFQMMTGSQPIGPGPGDLLSDNSGNLYGTTESDNNSFSGGVYELSKSGGTWNESTLYLFTGKLGNGDGAQPMSGVVADAGGNLYGTTILGGSTNCGGGGGCGIVYRLSPSASGWVESILYAFQDASDGRYPYGGLAIDASGNLYGTTSAGGTGGGGTVFELSPSGGNWTFSLLQRLPQNGTGYCGGPTGALVLDSSGDLYGNSCSFGADGYGTIFKLAHGSNGWTYTSLHDFTNGQDGAYPFGNILVDLSGNIYGTAQNGGANGLGTVWKITPQ